jgi:hypothetical protein
MTQVTSKFTIKYASREWECERLETSATGTDEVTQTIVGVGSKSDGDRRYKPEAHELMRWVGESIARAILREHGILDT